MTSPDTHNQSELRTQLNKYRTWSESVVLGTTLQLKPKESLDDKEILAFITANYTPKDLTDEKKHLTSTPDESEETFNNPPKQDLTSDNQSELERTVSLAVRRCGGRGMFSEVERISNIVKYVTANYTPNDEVERLVREAKS